MASEKIIWVLKHWPTSLLFWAKKRNKITQIKIVLGYTPDGAEGCSPKWEEAYLKALSNVIGKTHIVQSRNRRKAEQNVFRLVERKKIEAENMYLKLKEKTLKWKTAILNWKQNKFPSIAHIFISFLDYISFFFSFRFQGGLMFHIFLFQSHLLSFFFYLWTCPGSIGNCQSTLLLRERRQAPYCMNSLGDYRLLWSPLIEPERVLMGWYPVLRMLMPGLIRRGGGCLWCVIARDDDVHPCKRADRCWGSTDHPFSAESQGKVLWHW